MLSAILELLGPLPYREVRSAGGEADLHDVGELELLEELRALRLEDVDAGGDGVGEETAVGRVLEGACGDLWGLEAIDGVVRGRTTDETEGLLRAVCMRGLSEPGRKTRAGTDKRTAGTGWRPF